MNEIVGNCGARCVVLHAVVESVTCPTLQSVEAACREKGEDFFVLLTSVRAAPVPV